MKEKISVAMVASNLELNGISSVIMNYCRNIDANKFKITILAGSEINEDFKEECRRLNVEIRELYSKRKSKYKYYISLFKSIHKNEFDIFHVHGNSAAMALDLFVAYLKGIKVRIAHSHNTVCDNIKMHKLLSPIFQRLYTHAFACSQKAGEWIFNKDKFEIINNGIEIKKYLFDINIRSEVRTKLHIENDEVLIGHIRKNKLSKKSRILTPDI